MEGKIKWYRKEKGYGFITGTDDKDYFVHYSDLPEDMDNIDGRDVSFELKEGRRGPQAAEIKFLDESEDAE